MTHPDNGLPLVVSMGDPCGIGPEIIVRALAQGHLNHALVVGDVAVLRRALQLAGMSTPLAVVDGPADVAYVPVGCLALSQPVGLPDGLDLLSWGRVDARAGMAAAACISLAARWVLAGDASALVTAPVHKEALAAAGVGHPGHTEMLQALAESAVGHALPVRMMLANEELRVVLVTIHMGLRRAIELLDTPLILTTLRITDLAMRRFGIAKPRIGVAGLNPHAGEGGLFGDEELRLILPAITAARAEGIDASGPFAPDTVFMRARNTQEHAGEFDVVVAMTHDHGLIPVKYLGVEQGVNVTLGLPLVRTSPDHGTAFDIAGQGLADPSSLIAALKMARRLTAGGGPSGVTG